MTVPSTSEQGGTVSFNSLDSTFNYTPPINFIGLDTIIYHLCDDGVPPYCFMDSVFITVATCDTNPLLDCDGDGVATDKKIQT